MSSNFLNSESNNLQQLKEWKDRLDFYQKELPKVSITEKYSVVKIIEECKSEIESLRAKTQNSLSQLIEEEDRATRLNYSPENEKNNQRYKTIKHKLSKFNFYETVNQVETIIDEFDTDNGAVLFLLENDYDNGYEYLIPRLSELLQSKCLKEGAYLHRHFNFRSNTEQNEKELLNKLAEFFLPQSKSYAQKVDDYRKDVINAICEHIPGSGYILFMEFSGLDCFGKKQEDFLGLFVKNFWQDFIKRLEIVLTYKEIQMAKVICLLRTNVEIIQTAEYSNLYCQEDDFISKQIIKLNVKACKQKDVERFLYSVGLKKSKVDEYLDRINQFAKCGEPRRVCWKLDNILA